MQKLLYVVIFDLLYLAGQAQQLRSVREFADDQYLKGNYRSALKEYQRLLYFDERHEYVDTYAKIALLFYLNEDYDNAIRYFDFAYRAEQGDSLKYEYILKKALCNLRKGNYYAALNELYDLPDRKSGCLVHQKKIYLATCLFGLDQFDKSFEYISADADSFQVGEIKRLYEQLEKTRRKFNPKKIKLMSMILPGLGQAYTGNFVSAINSVALLSSIGWYATWTVQTYGYFEGFMVLSSSYYRYYTGGSKNAHHFAEQKIAIEKSVIFDKILNVIYPGSR